MFLSTKIKRPLFEAAWNIRMERLQTLGSGLKETAPATVLSVCKRKLHIHILRDVYTALKQVLCLKPFLPSPVIKTMQSIIRVTLGTALILLIPLIAMQFTSEMNWDLFDFIVMGALLFGTGLIYEFLIRKLKNQTHRIIAATVLVLLFLLVWADLAVGIFNIPGFSGS